MIYDPSTHTFVVPGRFDGDHVILGSDPKHVSITGHGQPALGNAMMFEGENIVLQFDDYTAGLSTGEIVTYTFSIDGMPEDAFLRASIVWTDPPSSPNTAHG